MLLKYGILEQGRCLHTLYHPSDINSVAISSDNSFIVTGSGMMNNTARIWDSRTGKLLHTLSGHQSQITSVADQF